MKSSLVEVSSTHGAPQTVFDSPAGKSIHEGMGQAMNCPV